MLTKVGFHVFSFPDNKLLRMKPNTDLFQFINTKGTTRVGVVTRNRKEMDSPNKKRITLKLQVAMNHESRTKYATSMYKYKYIGYYQP